MGKPKAPQPTDPKVTASAQLGQNVPTAIANSFLQNVNQATPYGSLNYNQTGSYELADPNSSAVYDVPIFTAEQSYTPAGQQLVDTNIKTQQALADLGYSQASRANSVLNTPFSLDGLPERADLSQIDPNFNAGPVQSSLGYNQPVASGFGGGGSIKTGFGNTKNAIPDATPLLNNAPGASVLSGLGRLQTGFDQNVGDIQQKLSVSPGAKTSFDDAGEITKTYNTDFSTDRRRVEDAILSRLNPQLDRQQESLRTQLINQGLTEGSAGFDRAMNRFGEQSNDAQMQTILAGGQEQSRLVGLESQRAQFQNSAQAQNYGQLADRARFSNEGSQIAFGQSLAAGQFENSAQAQAYNQAYQRAAFNNQAIGQDVAQNVAQANVNSTQFGQNLQAYDAALGANAQEFGQLYSRAQLNNQAQQQSYGQALGRGQFYNDSQAQGYNQALGSGQFANQAQQQVYGQQTGNFNANIALANAQNQNRNSALQETFAARNQPINEITALMNGSQVQNPNFVNANVGPIPTVDQAGIIANADAQRFNAWQANNANQQALIGGVLGAGASILSDERAKKNKKKVGSLKGHPLWEYNYKGEGKGTPKHVGVMAQEAEKKKPSAVTRGPDGLRRVDYGKLFDTRVA